MGMLASMGEAMGQDRPRAGLGQERLRAAPARGVLSRRSFPFGSVELEHAAQAGLFGLDDGAECQVRGREPFPVAELPIEVAAEVARRDVCGQAETAMAHADLLGTIDETRELAGIVV